jgi:hypothetical protein
LDQVTGVEDVKGKAQLAVRNIPGAFQRVTFKVRIMTLACPSRRLIRVFTERLPAVPAGTISFAVDSAGIHSG